MTSSSTLPDSAQRVATLLQNLNHPHPVRMLPATGKTSAEAAAGLGCDISAIAKSIIFNLETVIGQVQVGSLPVSQLGATTTQPPCC